jgi:hypothetical protein
VSADGSPHPRLPTAAILSALRSERWLQLGLSGPALL